MIRVDTKVHGAIDFDGASDFTIGNDNILYLYASDGNQIAVFHPDHWRHVEIVQVTSDVSENASENGRCESKEE